MRELTVEILKAAGRDPGLIDVPDPVASLISRFGFLPGAPLTRDQWLMLQRDNVAAKAPGLDAFGIRPTPFAAVAPEWLGMFGGSRFARRRVNLTATSLSRCRSSCSSSSSASSRASPNICRSPRPAI